LPSALRQRSAFELRSETGVSYYGAPSPAIGARLTSCEMLVHEHDGIRPVSCDCIDRGPSVTTAPQDFEIGLPLGQPLQSVQPHLVIVHQ
jgi:hypothetical protein